MEFKLLAFSDTHLGEDSSLLSFPQGRQRLWEVLRDKLGKGKSFDVEDVILMGDIPDRTLSSTTQIITHTNAFMETIGSAAHVIKRGIYIPGNHDHTIWTKYIEKPYGSPMQDIITGPAGQLIVKQGIPNQSDEVKDLLSLFFGYPCGSSWRAIERRKDFDFIIANPLYARAINGRTYVFTHGTHFRWDVTRPVWKKKLVEYLQLDRILGGIKVEPGEDIVGTEEMHDLERKVTPFVDSLWQSSRNNPTTQSDELWFIITHLSGKFESKRKTPISSELFKKADLPVATQGQRIAKILSSKDKSLELFNKYFCNPMLKHLHKYNVPTDEITFVYGDTHNGGWEDTFKAQGISDLMVYNTGGWVVDNKDDHPACHIFGVSGNGEEFMLDISFKDVKVDGDQILKLASEEVEHRKGVVSGILSIGWTKLIDYERKV
jgi:hypothetical protein